MIRASFLLGYPAGPPADDIGVNMESFPFNKNSVLKCRKFHLFNWTVHSGCSDPTQAHRAFGYRSCKQDTRKRYRRQQFCRMKRDISVPLTEIARPVKVNHLQSCSQIFRSDQTKMVRSIWCTNRNFRNFGLNGKRAYPRGYSNKSQNSE